MHKELSRYFELSRFDLSRYMYEGHPIKNETFFIIRKSVCVFS